VGRDKERRKYRCYAARDWLFAVVTKAATQSRCRMRANDVSEKQLTVRWQTSVCLHSISGGVWSVSGSARRNAAVADHIQESHHMKTFNNTGVGSRGKGVQGWCVTTALEQRLSTVVPEQDSTYDYIISLADRLPALNLPSGMVLVSTEVVTRSVMRHYQKPGCALAIFMRVL
jgi:hypothetical protein